jgi:SAM-dependent methyltransferase
MKLEVLEYLRCPVTNDRLVVERGASANDISDGWLITEDGRQRYRIRNGIPRFVPESNYADSFGMQWNRFRQTQLDSHSGHPISAERFWTATGWTPEELRGQWVLDVGCGSGRFAEVALNAGANVIALDLSSAVDACYANLKQYPNLHVVQGDIYNLPLARDAFPYVYSLGVLQHTPDVARAFGALPEVVHSGGRLCVDFYGKSWKSALLPKYWLRPLTVRIPQPILFGSLQKAVPVLLPISRGLGAIPALGTVLKRIVPVVNYYGMLPLSAQQHQEWALLDTFDMLAPKYDQPQTPATVRKWMENAGMTKIEVLNCGHLVTRGRK